MAIQWGIIQLAKDHSFEDVGRQCFKRKSSSQLPCIVFAQTNIQHFSFETVDSDLNLWWDRIWNTISSCLFSLKLLNANMMKYLHTGPFIHSDVRSNSDLIYITNASISISHIKDIGEWKKQKHIWLQMPASAISKTLAEELKHIWHQQRQRPS